MNSTPYNFSLDNQRLPSPVPWKLIDIVYSIVSSIVILVIFFVIVQIFILDGKTPEIIADTPNEQMQADIEVLIEYTFASAITLVSIWYFVFFRYGISIKTVLNTPQGAAKTIAYGLLYGVVIFGLSLSIDIFIDQIAGKHHLPDQVLDRIYTKKTFVTILSGLFYVCVCGPIIGEILFRGAIYNLIRNRHGFIKSAIICNVLFAISSFDPMFYVNIFAVGFLITYIYEKTKSLPLVILSSSTASGIWFVQEFWAIV